MRARGACGARGQDSHAGLEEGDGRACILHIETLSKAAECLPDQSGGVLTVGYSVTSSHLDKPADVIAVVDGTESVVAHIAPSEWTNLGGGIGQAGGQVALTLSLGSHLIGLCAQVGTDRACDVPFGVTFTCAPDPS